MGDFADETDGHLFVGLDRSTLRAKQTASGCVVMVLHREVKISDVAVHFHGEERVHLLGNNNGNNNNNNNNNNSNDSENTEEILPLFDARVIVWESAEKGGELIPPGTYTYFFEYSLPEGLPGTFSARDIDFSQNNLINTSTNNNNNNNNVNSSSSTASSSSSSSTVVVDSDANALLSPSTPNPALSASFFGYGACHIAYSVSAIASASDCRLQLETKALRVLETIPPPLFSQKISASTSKKFMMDFGGKGPATVKIGLVQSSFIANQTTPVSIDVENPSSKMIEGISFAFWERITARTGDTVAISERIISETPLPHSSIPPRTSCRTTVPLVIPPPPYASSRAGTLVNTSHFLEVKFLSKLSFSVHFSVVLNIRITERVGGGGGGGVPTVEQLEEKLNSAMQAVRGGEGGLVFGYHSEPNQNPRKGKNEDRVLICHDTRLAVFAVIDGHGGSECADYLEANLGQAVLSAGPNVFSDAGLKATFLSADVAFLKSTPYSSGACAVLCVIQDDELLCAHVGDCRALVGRNYDNNNNNNNNNNMLASLTSRSIFAANGGICLTEDHKPRRPDEVERIQAVGGIVVNGRMFGMLAVSRAFGDRELKHTVQELGGQSSFDYLDNAMTARVSVTALPEVSGITLRPEDEFLVLCCDGVFDVMTNDEVLSFIRPKLHALCQNRSIFKRNVISQEAVTAIAHALCMEAGRRLGHHDDITCLIVVLPPLTNL